MMSKFKNYYLGKIVSSAVASIHNKLNQQRVQHEDQEKDHEGGEEDFNTDDQLVCDT